MATMLMKAPGKVRRSAIPVISIHSEMDRMYGYKCFMTAAIQVWHEKFAGGRKTDVTVTSS